MKSATLNAEVNDEGKRVSISSFIVAAFIVF
jgi:hypothetical protein